MSGEKLIWTFWVGTLVLLDMTGDKDKDMGICFFCFGEPLIGLIWSCLDDYFMPWGRGTMSCIGLISETKTLTRISPIFDSSQRLRSSVSESVDSRFKSRTLIPPPRFQAQFS